MSFVAILMGSESDWSDMKSAQLVLKKFNINTEVRISSAHRTPDETREYIKDAVSRGCALFICAAGMAAHLAGTVAAHTVRPVIGVPIDSSPLKGMDALLSTVQMPGGIPVATVAIGSAGAKNAGYLAVQILSLANPSLLDALEQDRADNRKKIKEKNDNLNA